MSPQTKKSWLSILKEDPHAQRVAIVYACIFGFVLVAVIVTGISALKISEVKSVSGASTMLSTYAQVGATFAGFLIVGLIFLIQSRANKEWATKTGPLGLIRMFDIIFFVLATVVFSLMAISATDSLGYVSGLTQVDKETVNMVRGTAVLLRIGYALASIGFGALIANHMDRIKEIRLR
jgi:hypothetical protein